MQRDFLPANLRIPKQGRHTEIYLSSLFTHSVYNCC